MMLLSKGELIFFWFFALLGVDFPHLCLFDFRQSTTSEHSKPLAQSSFQAPIHRRKRCGARPSTEPEYYELSPRAEGRSFSSHEFRTEGTPRNAAGCSSPDRDEQAKTIISTIHGRRIPCGVGFSTNVRVSQRKRNTPGSTNSMIRLTPVAFIRFSRLVADLQHMVCSIKDLHRKSLESQSVLLQCQTLQ